MRCPTSTNSEVKIAILGSGSMGSAHADSYTRVKNAKVIGVFSRNRERAEAVAQMFEAKSVNDAFALLDDPTIDAIDVCVPSINHFDFVLAALQRGKHVFCETPFALQLRDAEVMIEAARRSSRILLVGLLVRSIAQYEHVHQVAASGRLGKILSVTTYRLSSYLRCGGPERKEHYTDPTTELMTFDFDFIQWLLGPPTSISATATKTESGSPGEVSAILNYDGGIARL
jgi:UDP-N-acetylglucosamine 3-dehydrogenase